MEIITVNLTEWQLKCLHHMVNSGFYTNRSEAIRAAIDTFIKQKLDEMERIKFISEGIETKVKKINPSNNKTIDMRSFRGGWGKNDKY